MSEQIGVSQEVLDAIELRLIGADHRPWMLAPKLRDENGQPYIVRATGKAFKEAQADHWITHARGTWLIGDIALFKLCNQATSDMGEFVARAPEDIETLLNEVKSLRARLRRVEDDRENFRKEMLSLRVEKSTLQEKLTSIRRTVRDFATLMKETS